MRSCVLGQVDSGKTKLLKAMSQINPLIGGEGGEMTQQVGSIQISREILVLRIASLQEENQEINIPGVLLFDTPGNQSIEQSQSGRIIQSLCDVAILVIDLMNGLQSQTLEFLEMIKKRSIPIIISLNKVDRLFGWKSVPGRDIYVALDHQESHCLQEFNERFIISP